MYSLLVISRVLHFAAVLLMFGGLVLALVVVGPVTRTSSQATFAIAERVGKFLRAVGWWGLGVSLLSGVTWLFLQAALMSGHSITEAASDGTLWLVLTDTTFGRVWMWRCGLAAALGALMFAQPLPRASGGPPRVCGLRLRSPEATSRRWRSQAIRPPARCRALRPDRRYAVHLSLQARGWARCRGLPCSSRLHCAYRPLRPESPRARREILDPRNGERRRAVAFRSCQRLVPGRRRAGTPRHAVRSTGGSENRAVRDDGGVGGDQSLAPDAALGGWRCFGAAPSCAKCGSRNRCGRCGRGAGRGAGSCRSRGPSTSRLALQFCA